MKAIWLMEVNCFWSHTICISACFQSHLLWDNAFLITVCLLINYLLRAAHILLISCNASANVFLCKVQVANPKGKYLEWKWRLLLMSRDLATVVNSCHWYSWWYSHWWCKVLWFVRKSTMWKSPLGENDRTELWFRPKQVWNTATWVAVFLPFLLVQSTVPSLGIVFFFWDEFLTKPQENKDRNLHFFCNKGTSERLCRGWACECLC